MISLPRRLLVWAVFLMGFLAVFILAQSAKIGPRAYTSLTKEQSEALAIMLDDNGGETPDSEAENLNSLEDSSVSSVDPTAPLLDPVATVDPTAPRGRFLLQNTGKHGLGHTMAEYNFGVTLSMKFNLNRVHVPVVCAHGEQVICDAFFGLSINQTYTIGPIEKAISKHQLRKVLIKGTPTPELLKETMDKNPGDDVVFAFEEARSSSNYQPTLRWWRGQMALARETPAWVTVQSTAKYDPKVINVALHLRRGDIVRKPNPAVLKKRFTDNEFYINTFKTIRSLFPEHKVVGHFISQGTPQDFADVAEELPDARILLTGSVLGDFRALIESDILVTAKSGYSHLAAVMSEGAMVVALPFWSSYEYLPDVIMADEKSSQGFKPQDFIKVWNKRSEMKRKGAVAVIPPKPAVKEDFDWL